MNTCSGCQAAIIPGAIVCGSCGMPVPVQSQPAGAVTLEVMEGGSAGARVALPVEGQEMTLGRHDLTQSPPWVVDVDLGRLMLLGVGEGAPVSRKQAVVARRAGQLLLTPLGAAPTLHRGKGLASFETVPVGTPKPVVVGDRIAFGHAGRVLVLEAR